MRKILICMCLLAVFSFPGPADDLFVIGTGEGEGELLVPTRILEGPDGNIYAFDRMDAYIKVYSPEGKYLRRMGGKGQGPGEVQRVDGLFFDFTAGGELFFTEFFQGHRWITLMNLEGDEIRVVKPDLAKYFGIAKAAALVDGRFIVELNFLAEPEKEKDYFLQRFPRRLVIMDKEGRLQSTILEKNHISRISLLDSGGDSPIPFTPNFIWCVPKGEKLVFSEGLGPMLELYSSDGDRLKELKTPLPSALVVTKKDLEAWKKKRREHMESRDPGWYARFGNVIEKYKKSIYKERPSFSSFEPTPEGNMVVRGLADEDSREVEQWLIASDGSLLGTLKSDLMGAVITRNFIIFAKQDEDFIVTAYALKRSGTEKEDFARLSGM